MGTAEKEKNIAKGFQPLGERVLSPIPKNWNGLPAEFMCRIRQTATGSVPAVTLLPRGGENDRRIGDHVLFDKYSGSKLRIEDEECLILKEEDILGIFTA